MMLQGDKVRLRAVTDEDLREVYRLIHDPLAWGEFEDLHPIDWFSFEKQARERDADTDKRLSLLIETIPGKTIVGTIFYRLPDRPIRVYEIGYAIWRPEERGKGYASEAVRLVTDLLFSTRNIERVEAYTDVRNVASHKALERSGFRREGLLRKCRFVGGAFRDYFVYALIREDWHPR